MADLFTWDPISFYTYMYIHFYSDLMSRFSMNTQLRYQGCEWQSIQLNRGNANQKAVLEVHSEWNLKHFILFFSSQKVKSAESKSKSNPCGIFFIWSQSLLVLNEIYCFINFNNLIHINHFISYTQSTLRFVNAVNNQYFTDTVIKD